MDPAAASSRAGRTLHPMRPLRRVLFAAVAGAAWLTLSGTAAQADDACTLAGTDDAGDRAAAAECRNADDLPVPSLDGLASLDIAPAPAGTWSAGAVPVPKTDVSDFAPADADQPAQAGPRSAAPDSPPSAMGPDLVPAAVDPTLPDPAPTPPVVDPGVPGVDPAVPDPVVVPPVIAPPVVSPPVVDPPVVSPPVVDPAAPDPGVVPPVVDPTLPVPDPAGPLPGGPAAVPSGGVVPGGVPAGTPVGTPAAVDGASTSAGTATGTGTGKAGTATEGTAKAAAPRQPSPTSFGPDAARPLEAYRPQIAPVDYASWLMPEPRAAAPVRQGAAPSAERPAGTGAQPDPSGNPGPGPSPWHGGTGLPAPEALPPAPGTGSGNGNSPNGPAGTAAWMPSLFFYLPTIGADPIGGPLQHEYAAVCADPGSSPD